MNRPISKKVLVTDLECPSALASVRALGRAGFEVHGLGLAECIPALASRYLRSYSHAPSPWLGLERFQEAVHRCVQLCRPDFILPVSEAAIQCFRRSRGQSAKTENSILMGSETLLDLGLSKIATFQRSVDAHLPVASGFILFPGQPLQVGGASRWPLVVRTDNSFSEASVYKKGRSWVVRCQKEFDSIRKELDSLGVPCLVQEYIDGFGCGVFFLLWQGEVVLWHSHRRLAEIPWYGGISARRQIEFDESLLNIGRRLFSDSRISGLAMIEFRVCKGEADSKLLKHHVVEVNARPWGSMSLALHAGISFLPAWVDLYLSKNPRNAFAQESCVNECRLSRKKAIVCTSIYPGEFQHLLSVLQSWWNNELSNRMVLSYLAQTFLCLFNPKTRYDYLMLDDPLPSIVQFFVFIQSIIGYVCYRIKSITFKVACLLVRKLIRRRRLKDILSGPATRSILVVCLGNRCRSPFFEMSIRHKLGDTEFKIYSRGFVDSCKSVPQRFFGTFKTFGLEPEQHSSKQLSRVDIDAASCIFLMEYNHFYKMFKQYGWRVLTRCYLPSEIDGSFVEVCDPYILDPVKASRVFEDLNIFASSVSKELAMRGMTVNCLDQHLNQVDPKLDSQI